MKRQSFHLLVLAICTCTASSYAQFRTPTPAELTMTSDSKAPGVDAVYLNKEVDINDALHSQSVYARIKILTDKGIELSAVELPHDHRAIINKIEGRTIHPDGTIVPLSLSENSSRRNFALPNVTVGSIIEYSYQFVYDARTLFPHEWDIQGNYYVHMASYSFTPADPNRKVPKDTTDPSSPSKQTLLIWSNLPNGVSIAPGIDGRFTLQVSDVNAVPREAWMPTEDTYRYRAVFYYIPSGTGNDYWEKANARWSSEVETASTPSPEVTAFVAGVISPSDLETERAKKLYKAIQNLLIANAATPRVVNSTAYKTATESLLSKNGSGDDMAILYLASLRAAHISARAMKVADRSIRLFDSSYLFDNQLTSTIVLAELGGKTVYLDPGDRMTPFGTLNWRHSNASGMVQGQSTNPIATTPSLSYSSNRQSRVVDIQLSSNGEATGSIRLTLTGQEATHLRDNALRNSESSLQRYLDRWMTLLSPAGFTVHTWHIAGLNDPNTDLQIMMNINGKFSVSKSKNIEIPVSLFSNQDVSKALEQNKRLTLLDVHYAAEYNDSITYHLPEGYSSFSVPVSNVDKWHDITSFSTRISQSQGKVEVHRDYYYAYTFVKPEEYSGLHNFLQKMASIDHQKLLLSTFTGTSGN